MPTLTRTIAVNGVRLDEVRLPLDPYAEGTVSFLSYPAWELRALVEGRGLQLILPACLCVELYRSGLLPQDSTMPVEIALGGRSIGRYVVTDVRYPRVSGYIYEPVRFTLTYVARRAEDGEPSGNGGAGLATLVVDITHYLDAAGELLPSPAHARMLAGFIGRVIVAATGSESPEQLHAGVRCRKRGCRGTIRTVLPPGADEIAWQCSACGDQGLIRNWQATKWNRRERRD